jgi:hypothetical protein
MALQLPSKGKRGYRQEDLVVISQTSPCEDCKKHSEDALRSCDGINCIVIQIWNIECL